MQTVRSNKSSLQRQRAGKRQDKGRQRSVIHSRVRKVQNGRQAQGQGRQNGQHREDKKTATIET